MCWRELGIEGTNAPMLLWQVKHYSQRQPLEPNHGQMTTRQMQWRVVRPHVGPPFLGAAIGPLGKQRRRAADADGSASGEAGTSTAGPAKGTLPARRRREVEQNEAPRERACTTTHHERGGLLAWPPSKVFLKKNSWTQSFPTARVPLIDPRCGNPSRLTRSCRRARLWTRT